MGWVEDVESVSSFAQLHASEMLRQRVHLEGVISDLNGGRDAVGSRGLNFVCLLCHAHHRLEHRVTGGHSQPIHVGRGQILSFNRRQDYWISVCQFCHPSREQHEMGLTLDLD